MHTALRGLVVATALFASPAALAATVVTDNLNPTGVATFFFSFTGGAYSIQVDPRGNTNNQLADPEIFLFADDGSPKTGLTGALIGQNDDINFPTNLSARLSGNLAAGNYVLAVGQFNFTQAEARAGVANYDRPGAFTATFSDGITLQAGAVPEPATWAMLMLGFGAMGATLRRKQKVAARIRFA